MVNKYKANVVEMTFSIALHQSKVHVREDKCLSIKDVDFTVLTAQVMCGCSAVWSRTEPYM